MDDVDRIHIFAEDFFNKHNHESWPTVRQVARGLKLRQYQVEDAIEGDPKNRLMLTSFPTETALGDHFVEAYQRPTETVGSAFENWADDAQDLLRRCRMVLSRTKEGRDLAKEIAKLPPPPAAPDPDWISKQHSSHKPGL